LLATEIKALEIESTAEDFWQDQENAKEVLSKLELKKKELETFKSLTREVSDTLELAKITSPEEDEKSANEIKAKLPELAKAVEKLELQTLLTQKYDHSDTLLAIHAGTGGLDAQDWANMLLRMYLRFAENKDYKAKIIDISEGEEGGLKRATVEIKGPLAFGYLKSEAGVHRLVRLSPFNSGNTRETSFALVDILPVLSHSKEIKIDPNDLRIDTYRAQGAGGQHVNKTDSAVRIVHEPTGITVQCQSERSQLQNKEQALKVLRSRLALLQEEKKQEEKDSLRGEYGSIAWGNQIRSYVLHPYKMVKDHRTKAKTSQAESVLEGDLDLFVEAYLRSNVKT